jgi:hypothetical protein
MVWCRERATGRFRSGILRIALLLVVTSAGLTNAAGASTHYIAANGSDSNNGTSKTTPWLHAPGMPNCSGSCASYKPAPGDSIIFRGGDTWHFGNSALSPYTGGTWDMYSWWGNNSTCVSLAASSGCIYYGVDQTWFSGGSWVRPILDGDNPLSTSLVSSSRYQVANTGQYDHKSLFSLAQNSKFYNI